MAGPVARGAVALARQLADGSASRGAARRSCARASTTRARPRGAREHRIKAAFRGTAIRFSTHVYNDAADIEKAASVIGPLVAQPVA